MTPTITLRESNATQTLIAQMTSEPFVTATPLVTDTPPVTPPAETASAAAPVTITNTPSARNSSPANPVAGVNLKNVWTTEGLVPIYKNLGVYPPEPPLEHLGNVNALTGLEVSNRALLQRRPILVRLGNDPTIRNQQAGFNEADLVFEELIDQKGGGFALTRFTLVFLGNNGTFRPLRSARLVNLSVTPMFDGALLSSGGSDKNRWILSQVPWANLNLDADLNNRLICIIGDDYRSRFASTVEHIHEYLGSRGLDKAIPLRGFQFSPDPADGRPVDSIAFDKAPWPVFSAGAVEWRYSADSGRYLRFINGAAHNTLQYSLTPNWASQCQTSNVKSAQISAANLVTLYAAHEETNIIEDSLGFANIYIVLTGEGKAQILRDGVLLDGKWRRPTLQHFFEFVDATDQVIRLKPGNTWFEIVPPGFTPTIKYGNR